MRIIPTAMKEKLPKGFSYPLGAKAISEGLGLVVIDKATLWFCWRDEYWASSWRDKIDRLGTVTLLEVSTAPFSADPVLRVYAVPSEYSLIARDHLLAELARVQKELLLKAPAERLKPVTVKLSLLDAGAANKSVHANPDSASGSVTFCRRPHHAT